MNVSVLLTWSDADPEVVVVGQSDRTEVHVDPRLSALQVMRACQELPGLGAEIFHQWCTLVTYPHADTIIDTPKRTTSVTSPGPAR